MRARSGGATGSTSSSRSGSAARASATCCSRRPRPPPIALYGREELADRLVEEQRLLDVDGVAGHRNDGEAGVRDVAAHEQRRLDARPGPIPPPYEPRPPGPPSPPPQLRGGPAA